MQSRWIVIGFIVGGLVLGLAGLLDPALLSPSTVAAGNFVNKNYSDISNVFLLIVVVLSLARYFVLYRETQWGIGSRTDGGRGFGSLVMDLGPTGAPVADAFTAWTAFTTATAILATLFNGQLLAAVPNLPFPGEISLGLMMAAMLGISGWIIASSLLDTFGSPVLSTSWDCLVLGHRPPNIAGTVTLAQTSPPATQNASSAPTPSRPPGA